MYLIDSNIFLELFLNQHKKELAKEIFQKIENKEIKAIISGYSLHSIEYILSIKKEYKLLRIILEAISDFENLTVYFTSVEEDIEILNICKNGILDFDDASQYFVAKKFGAGIITFDKDFKNIKDIEIQIIS